MATTEPRLFRVGKILQRLVDGATTDQVARELRTTTERVDAVADEWGYPVRHRLVVALDEIEAAHRRGSPYPQVDVPMADDYAPDAAALAAAAATPQQGPPTAPDTAQENPEVHRALDEVPPPAASTGGIPCADPTCDRTFTMQRGATRHYRETHEAAALLEEGRRLASQREDLIAAGADPADLVVPLAPEVPATPAPADPDELRIVDQPAPRTIDSLLGELQDLVDEHADRGSEAVHAIAARLNEALDQVQLLTVQLDQALAADAEADALREQVAALDAEAERLAAQRAAVVEQLASRIPARLSPDQQRRCRAWAIASGHVASDRAHMGRDVITAWWVAGCPGGQQAAS